MILLGVCGSIAAYKAVEVLRLFRKAGQDVRVLMTETAAHFVGGLTFRALSGHSVHSDLMDPQEWRMAHLDLSDQAAAFVIAPASADLLSRLARGAAGDILSATALSLPRAPSGKLKIPLFIAPALHEAMWTHPATQANARVLKAYGYQFIGPVRGPLGRMGDAGIGRLADPAVIVKTVLQAIQTGESKKR